MSISICKENSIGIFDFNNKCAIFRKKRVEKVKRTLFGPIDYEETENMINTHLKKAEEDFCNKWNFDFANERVLESGNWSWRPASPVKINRKRKVEINMIDASTSLYFQPIDPIVGQNSTSSIICKPQPNNSKPIKKQSFITDFMRPSKSGMLLKKETSNERPKKIPKLGDCSS